MHADKRFVIHIQHRAFCRHGVDWVRPVEHNDRDAALFASAHAKIERPDESVIARADFLKIYEKNIEPVQHFRSRLAVFAVKTVNRNMEPRMFVTFPFHHVVLRLAKESMLWTKKRCEPKEVVIVSLQDSRGVFKA